jgi:putative intracellular protease/amidase
MKHTLRVIAHIGRRLVLPVVLLLAFVLPPLAVVIGNMSYGAALTQQQLRPQTAEQALPTPPAYDPAKKTALLVAGNTATESSDLLGPYEVLATSGQFNVFVVAPERKLTPLIPIPDQLCCGTMDLLPHYSFAEYDQAVGVTPDLVVVPYIPYASTKDTAVLDWLRTRPGEQTLILSICGGSQMVADAGLLAGHRAVSHHTLYPYLPKWHPEVTWTPGLRYVDDGRFISSAGVTSGVDATLHVLDRLFGRQTAMHAALQMGYPHTNFLDDPTWNFTVVQTLLPAIMPNAFRGERTQIGLVLHEGVGEVELTSITDAYPRSTVADVLTIAPEQAFIRTAHGLDLLPRYTLASAPALDRVLTPGNPDASTNPAVTHARAQVDEWAAKHGLTVERIHASGDYPYDATLRDLARQETRPMATWAAAWLEYPTADLALDGRDWQSEYILRAIGLGALSVIAILGARRALGLAWSLRSRHTAPAPRPSTSAA